MEWLPGLVDRHFESGGRHLRYFAGGQGPPVLLLHGLGGSAFNWVEVAPELVARRRVLIPDLPGHGGSAPLGRMTSLSALAEPLAELARAERASPALVVGHSLGGLVALRLAAGYPESVSGVVLAAAAGISSTRRSVRYALEMLALLKPARRLARYRTRIAPSPQLRTLVFGWWGVSDPAALAPRAVEGFLAGWQLHTDTLSAARAMVLDDVRADLDRVRCPCIVLWGARDHQLGVADAFDYARRLRAQLRVIPDCGHLLIGERPDAVVDAVEALDRIRQLDELPVDAEPIG